MKALNNKNQLLATITEAISTQQTDRATIVNDIIKMVIAEAKDSHISGTKKEVQAFIINVLLDEETTIKSLDNYTKRALKVSRKLLIDGYQIKKELLTIAQAEDITKCDKDVCNSAMKTHDDDYVDVIKALVSARKVTEALAKLAEIKDADGKSADALLTAIKAKFGADTKKVLNLLLQAV